MAECVDDKEEDVLAAIDAFDAEYGRDIKLPSEVL